MLETILGAMASNPSMILPVDVYGSGETTTTYDVMEGIVQAVNAGANPINLSLGGAGNSSMLESLIAQAQQKGVEFVAASGNTPGTEDTYPAAYPGVLAVTASAPNGQLAPYADDGSFCPNHVARHRHGGLEWSGMDRPRHLHRHREHDRRHHGFGKQEFQPHRPAGRRKFDPRPSRPEIKSCLPQPLRWLLFRL
jgi:hypothetical protein